jgi:hypothetical protein
MNRDLEQKNTSRQYQMRQRAPQQPTMVNFPSLFSSQLDNVEGTADINGHQLMMPQEAQLQQVQPQMDEKMQADFFNSRGFFPIDCEIDDLDNLPGPYDIICGRCSTAFNNDIGNRQFRATIDNNLPMYLEAHTQQDKSLVIITIIKRLEAETGARFLKRKGGKFVELNEKHVRRKVDHALRDMARRANHLSDLMVAHAGTNF